VPRGFGFGFGEEVKEMRGRERRESEGRGGAEEALLGTRGVWGALFAKKNGPDPGL
jgi:hypothetical protein